MIKSVKGTWVSPETTGLNPSQRWGHSASYSHGHLYVFGGCCGGLHFSDVMSLDLKTMEWSSLISKGNQPGTRDSHTAVVNGHEMIVFGGTNGTKKINQLHILDLHSREWRQPHTLGRPPPPRESHSATLLEDDDNNEEEEEGKIEGKEDEEVEEGKKKRKWKRRRKLIVFGGSGEGDGNYLNDVHILDLDSMTWSSPDVKGELPAPRDSHTAVAIGKSLIVYGGDCGDHYIGEVNILDLQTFTWSRLKTTGSTSFPGVRAGHASVAIGSKVYVIGGVGERAYYNDVWTLDMNTRTWSQLQVAGPQPQGRFSHSAILVESKIVIYGGCGEDERPLDEILFLNLAEDHDTAALPRMRKFFPTPCMQEHRKLSDFRRVATEGGTSMQQSNHMYHDLMGKSKKDATPTGPVEKRSNSRWQSWKDELNQTMKTASEDEGDAFKRRKLMHSKKLESEAEQEEHSHSNSQQSSPSESEQDHNIAQKRSKSPGSHSPLGMFLKQSPKNIENRMKQPVNQYLHNFPVHPPHPNNIAPSHPRADFQQAQALKMENMHPVPALHLKACVPHNAVALPMHGSSQNMQFQVNGREEDLNSGTRRVESSEKQQRVAVTGIVSVPNLVGSEVRGMVDAVFDSGYLMTAQVNGQIFRGLLFSPGPAMSNGDANLIPVYTNASVGNSVMVSQSPTRLHNSTGYLNAAGGVINVGQAINNFPGFQVATGSSVWGHPADASNSVPQLSLMLKSPSTNVSETASNRQMRINPPVTIAACPITATNNVGQEVVVVDAVDKLNGVANGHWVWHPPLHHQPTTATTTTTTAIPMDQEVGVVQRRGNHVQFIAVQQAAPSGFVCQPTSLSLPSPNHENMQQSVILGGHAASSSTSLPTPYSESHAASVTLSLAVPGQHHHPHSSASGAPRKV